MKIMNIKTLCLSSLLTLGCMGSPGALDDSSSGLVEIDASTVPLPALGSDTWRSAPAGCEGLLEAQPVTFVVASLADGLVAALDIEGEVVCVDSVEAVQEELEEQGEEEAADDLGARFSSAVAIASLPEFCEKGDPTPEPNIEDSRSSMSFGERDPTPEPN